MGLLMAWEAGLVGLRRIYCLLGNYLRREWLAWRAKAVLSLPQDQELVLLHPMDLYSLLSDRVYD